MEQRYECETDFLYRLILFLIPTDIGAICIHNKIFPDSSILTRRSILTYKQMQFQLLLKQLCMKTIFIHTSFKRNETRPLLHYNNGLITTYNTILKPNLPTTHQTSDSHYWLLKLQLQELSQAVCNTEQVYFQLSVKPSQSWYHQGHHIYK